MSNATTPKPTTFRRGQFVLAAQLYTPADAASDGRRPAVVIVGPSSSVKEQIAANYAKALAALGFVALTFDPAYQGQSSGEPRDLESPAERVADLRSAVDFVTTLAEVDEESIGMLGVCAGGGYAVAATLTDRRVKALGVVVPIDIGNAFRQMAAANGGVSRALESVANQAIAEAHGATASRATWVPDSLEDAQAAGLNDIDLIQAVTFYRTPRGSNPHSTNRRHYLSDALILGFDAFNLVDQILAQPVQVIVGGDSAGTTGSFEDGHRLAKLAPAAEPVFVIEGARHYEMYDTPKYIEKAVRHLDDFYTRHLVSAGAA